MQIKFSKPNIQELNKQGFQCVDMHFHTSYSDGIPDVCEILKKSRKNKFGIAIADHNEIKGVLEAFEKKTKEDFIIPAIEVKSKELIDVLFYFYDINELKKFYEKEIKPNKKNFLHITKTTLSLEEVYDLTKKYNCVSSVAHPFGYSMRAGIGEVFDKYKKVLSKFDVVEIINGGNLRKHNIQSMKYINKNNKVITGGSDAHTLNNVGTVLTCSKANTVKGFLDDVKNNKVMVIGIERKKGKLGHYVDYVVALTKKIISKKR